MGLFDFFTTGGATGRPCWRFKLTGSVTGQQSSDPTWVTAQNIRSWLYRTYTRRILVPLIEKNALFDFGAQYMVMHEKDNIFSIFIDVKAARRGDDITISQAHELKTAFNNTLPRFVIFHHNQFLWSAHEGGQVEMVSCISTQAAAEYEERNRANYDRALAGVKRSRIQKRRGPSVSPLLRKVTTSVKRWQ